MTPSPTHTLRSRSRRPTAALLAVALAGVPAVAGPLGPKTPQEAGHGAAPPSRALSRALTAAPRLAGTPASELATTLVARTLTAAGWEVELDRREVLLSYPRRLAVRAIAPDGTALFDREDHFDPDAWPPEDVPLFHGWSASGVAEGPVVDVGHGLPADFEALRVAGVELEGAIALARYGRGYRGVKAEQAEAHGCAGVLLFNDPAVDGPGRGEPWPAGPWKPEHEAERGAIASIARGPGDPTTPGWPSPAPGADGRRLDVDAAAPALPGIPSLPLASAHAQRLLATPGARVRMEVDAPRVLRTITNVLGRLPGAGDALVLAGNHRDAWVRGAQDAASGTVSLLRAAEILGNAVRDGWQPRSTLVLGFWDAEEYGLIGSTEWAEAHAERLRSDARVYVNADAVVSGLRVRVAGTPGLEPLVEEALTSVPAPGAADGTTLADQWRASRRGDVAWSLALPGSGSDYTVFLHHLGLPVLDVSFGGNGGGQYHTAFDDFETMDRWLDPTWQGHETAGRYLAAQLRVLADAPAVLDDARAARAMAAEVRRAGAPGEDGEAWLGEPRAERLARAFDALAAAVDDAGGRGGPRFHQALQRAEGLPGRPWYRNVLWAPGLGTGYAAETLPTLRAAAGDEVRLEAELERLVAAVDALAEAWRAAAAEAGK